MLSSSKRRAFLKNSRNTERALTLAAALALITLASLKPSPPSLSPHFPIARLDAPGTHEAAVREMY